MIVSHALNYESKGDLLAICGDAQNTATVKRPPCSITILPGNCKVTNTNDVLIITSRARESLDFLTIQGIELDFAGVTIFLEKFNRNDGGTGILNQSFNQSGLVHWLGFV